MRIEKRDHERRRWELDRSEIQSLIEQIRALRRDRFDYVERAGKLQLPLVLGTREQFERAFHCAIAELTVTYGDRQKDLALILETYFDRKTIAHFYDTHGRLNFLQRGTFTPISKRRIIGIAYPWYNQWLYLSLARATRTYYLDSSTHLELEGKYRYFRYYPKSSSKFVIGDGFIVIAVDRKRNMILFGDQSRNYRDATIFEHRGFVLPSRMGRVSLMGFRDDVIRMATIEHPGQDISSGILSTVTRGNGRPFSSKFILVREGVSGLYDLEIPSLDFETFDPNSKQYRIIETELSKLNEGTAFVNEGFLWGGPAQ